MRLIFTIVFFTQFLLKSLPSLAITNSDKDFQISVFTDTSNTIGTEGVKTLLNTHRELFISPGKMLDLFSPDYTYWLYVTPPVLPINNQEFVLTFHVWVSLIEVYPYPFSSISEYGGRMVPGRLKAISGCNVPLKPDVSGYLIKVQNRLHSNVSVKDIEILPSIAFHKKKEKKDLIQGIIVGFLWLILIYNLFLYILIRKKIHLYYIIYIFLNSFFLLFTFSYSETYIFPNHYELNLILITFQLMGMFFYIMFLRMSLLGHCTKYTPFVDRRTLLPYAYIMLIGNLVAASTIFYQMDIFRIVSDLSNLINCIVGISVFIIFYRSSDWFLRMIMIASAILVLSGWISVLYAVFNINSDNLFYEVGLLVELLLFTYALNKLHFEEKYKAELTKLQLESELDSKNRELVYQAIQLTAKDEVIASIKGRIKKLELSENHNIFAEENWVESTLNKNMWKEFEVHFTKTHPGFYKSLMEKYPELTQGEIRLCAFLKLNLNTKEIAMITKRSPRSIEVMRSRVRQKMDLSRDGNLNQILTQM